MSLYWWCSCLYGSKQTESKRVAQGQGFLHYSYSTVPGIYGRKQTESEDKVCLLQPFPLYPSGEGKLPQLNQNYTRWEICTGNFIPIKCYYNKSINIHHASDLQHLL